MSQVSFATAKALKEAGLPQPMVDPLQIWYFDTGNVSLQYLDFPELAVKKLLYFAPDVDYILPLIGNNALVKFRKDETGQIWECNIDEGDGRERLLGYHETNPAEAAAMAWLRLNENDQYASDWLDSVTNETPSKTFVKPGAPGE